MSYLFVSHDLNVVRLLWTACCDARRPDRRARPDGEGGCLRRKRTIP